MRTCGALPGRPRQDLHGLFVEGDGGDALGFLQDDGGGGAQAALTCAATEGVRRLRTLAYSRLLMPHSRGSASFSSSLFSLLMEDEEDILWTCVCRFCSSTTEKARP